jgi:cell division transport system permease protein
MEELSIDVFIDNSIDNEKSEILCNKIDSLSESNSFIFYTKEELYKKINTNADLNKWIGDDLNFLPCLCSIKLNSKETSEISGIVELIKQKYDNKINRITYPQSYLLKFDKFISSIYSFIFIVGILVLIVSIFNVSNVIKLNLDNRKEIVNTLILHGADRFIIRSPFIIEGIFQGILGSLLSCIIIIFIFNLDILNGYNHFMISSFISTISIKTYLLLNVIFGILLGFIGSNLGTSNRIKY